MFFESVVNEDRNVLDLSECATTRSSTRRWRDHYGIPNVYGPRFRRVTLTDESRRGLLGQGSVLTVTSYATRTSPVLRGKWILTNILGTPPPAPPPNVPALKENNEGGKILSVRERLEEHRKSPACASCHKIMDPLGFALENFDAIGQWRAKSEDGAPIDASGVLLDGSKVNGPATLRAALMSRPEVFVTTLTEKLMTYALGRGVDYNDDAGHSRHCRARRIRPLSFFGSGGGHCAEPAVPHEDQDRAGCFQRSGKDRVAVAEKFKP